MAFRSDLTFDWATSPRLITVQAPSTELTITDAIDTIRQTEAEIDNLVYPKMMDADGNRDLDGTKFTGKVLALLDTRIAFADRPFARQSGTADAGSDGTHLVDATGDFIQSPTADGVQPGATIVNLATGAHATALEVQDDMTIRHTQLTGGQESPDNAWGVGDTYIIWNIAECSITGGDIVSEDAQGNRLNPILPTFGTHVVIAQATEAALIDPDITTTALAQAVWTEDLEQYIDQNSAARDVLLNQVFQSGDRETDPDTGIITIRKTLPSGRVFVMTGAIWEDAARTIPYRGAGIEVQEELVETSP